MTSTAAPPNTGIGVPSSAPAPANLGRSGMSQQPSAATSAIPFTRGSSDATMTDATRTYAWATAQSDQISLQTNAFLTAIVLEFTAVAASNAATVAYNSDAPYCFINLIRLDDPAGQGIISPISGYGLYLLNKYLPDTGCRYDPEADPNFRLTAGSAGAGGSFSFRLILPIEHRHRDAFGALNNSAANQRYLITLTTSTSVAAAATPGSVYSTGPTTAPTNVNLTVYQQYWTSPPATITTSQGSSQVQATPAGLGTVAFVRYERHNEVSGGGSPQIQLNNVGDYISSLIFVLRNATNGGQRDGTTNNGVQPVAASGDWPTEFDWWVNDFQLHALNVGDWQRGMARFYGYNSALGPSATGVATTTPNTNANALDIGVFTLYQMIGLFDRCDNFEPAGQYLPTDSTTKLQIRGSTFGSGASFLEVYTRMIRPVSGAALFN
jgi:hypothetical protein